MMNESFLQLELLIDELTTLGEDGQELDFWKKLFPSLAKQEQEELLENLRQEITSLKAR